ncbi:hypothetical protein [Tenuibacillus multivorans]|uniref:Uncharacterized protein n=1 Tax=Tenuibacillus multivorans TaxID=237069 RepID=A0A1H0DG07_9BACI|nr:hypothetical protein [Tenuibacillus multivorans]GEL76573.1 hypothetical protein TMU01_08080 [Tenuibacillus multivorans]SDN68936.1 hypothetical protein SAMN05216498_2852 [Tenuibacillus multivorans]
MISILPKDYREKDPRQLLYHFPNMPIVKYAKMMQRYSFNHALAVAEDVAHKNGYILIPYDCMHWQRKQRFVDRRVKIGRKSFFMMKDHELTRSERSKLEDYLRELEVG